MLERLRVQHTANSLPFYIVRLMHKEIERAKGRFLLPRQAQVTVNTPAGATVTLQSAHFYLWGKDHGYPLRGRSSNNIAAVWGIKATVTLNHLQQELEETQRGGGQDVVLSNKI